jgi:hypothetical protein
VKETHHFYPVLFYLRFEETYYAASRMLLVALDAATLIRTALDPRELGWLQESAALAELEHASTLLLRTLNQSFPVHDGQSGDSPQSRERWRRRYERALLRLREADIPTRPDPDAGAREYVELRAHWGDGYRDSRACARLPHGRGGHGGFRRTRPRGGRLRIAAVHELKVCDTVSSS